MIDRPMIVAAAVGVSACFLGANVAVLAEQAPSYEYRVLATNKTSTMQREIQEAGDAGFEYKGQTVFTTTFGGKEVVAILERNEGAPATARHEYRLVATKKTSTLQKELAETGEKGFEFVGVTVGADGGRRK